MKSLLLIVLGFVLGALAASSYFVAFPTRVVHAAETQAPGTIEPATPLSTQAPAISQTPSPEPVSAAPPQPPVALPASPAVLPAADMGDALLLPVHGITREQLQDTFTDARSQGRSHDAIDIMAPAGTPVLAVADGSIEKLFTSDRGGLTIYQFEPSGRLAYYYAHLQSYAQGIAQGQSVKRGQLLGYVGSTGNADPAAPHLHFAIFVLGPERNWWQGQAINPYPVLMGRSVP